MRTHFPLILDLIFLRGYMSNRVVILSEQSLFVVGIESRLREYPQRLDIYHIDPEAQDYIKRIAKIQPTAIILDAATKNKSQCCVLCDLLMTFTSVIIIRLAADQRDVQMIKSTKHQFSEVQELIDVLEEQP